MPRAVALDALDAVLRRHQPLAEVMANPGGSGGGEGDRNGAWGRLAPRDRAFAYTLVATTLRRLGQIDALIETSLHKPLPSNGHVARNLLRLGICQLVVLGTPAHAAVDTTVGLARRYRQGRYLGLINAVLRRLAADGRRLMDAEEAARPNTPDWLWRSWTAAYGEHACRRIAAAHLDEPPLDLTPRAQTADEGVALAARLGAERLPTGTLRLRGANLRAAGERSAKSGERGAPSGAGITALDGFAGGEWWVQDAAAALPVRLLGPLAGLRILDLCAAPGGKTAQLAAAGARVTAVDRAPERLERLRANLRRLGLAADLVAADVLAWQPAESADAVVLDVPCSATGTIRRHPDVARLKQPRDVEALAALQARLLEAASAMVRPGGLLIYCACSLQPEEGPERIAAFLGSGAPFAREAVSAAELCGLAEAVSAEGDLRTLPFMWAEAGGMDGFFAARLRRGGVR